MHCEQPPRSTDSSKDDVDDTPLTDEPVDMEEEEEEEVDLEELNEEELREFHVLNRQLDALDQVLDSLEEKNDVIHSQLKDLLEDSKKTRLEIQQSNQEKWARQKYAWNRNVYSLDSWSMIKIFKHFLIILVLKMIQ